MVKRQKSSVDGKRCYDKKKPQNSSASTNWEMYILARSQSYLAFLPS